ncbi:HAD hydrolase-like protein [Kitasatospora sp. NPDC018058]|uniref:HAD hydrolase-like protein n=1 Tax=Kitasatospora sp. NPDC018058 TaxID=3364025 RepID=UPI0037BFCAA9
MDAPPAQADNLTKDQAAKLDALDEPWRLEPDWTPAGERLCRPPQECVFVGDSVVIDVEGAQGAGLHPVPLDRYARFPDFTGPRATALDGFAALAARVPIPAGRTAR